MDNVYLIISKDVKKTNEEIEKIKSKYENYDFNVHDFDDHDSLAVALEDINTIPFFTDSKIVVFKNANFMFSKNYDSDEVKLNEELIRYINDPQDYTSLIICVETLTGLNDLYVKAFKNVVKIEPKALKLDFDNELDYILSLNGYKMDSEARNELKLRVKGDASFLDVELDKLMTYKNDEKKITLIDVKDIVPSDMENDVFTLVNAVLESNKKKALNIYYDLNKQNVPTYTLISSLLNQFNLLYKTKILASNGMTKDEMAKAVGVSSGRMYFLMNTTKTISLDKIKRNINNLTDLDVNIKSGKIDTNLGFELYLLK